MLTRVTGNTGGIFKDVAAMVNAGSKNGRRLELYDGTRYQVSSTDDGGGVLLSTGNFANKVNTPDVDGLLSRVNMDNVNLTNLDSPLFQGFQPNKLTAVSAPSGTDSDVTHTRAGTATYIDRYDVLKTAGIDELRETADGYQIEAVGSTNQFLHSSDFQDASWSKVEVGVSISPSDDMTNLLAYSVIPNMTNSIHGISQVYTASAGDTQTVTFIVKSKELGILQVGSNTVQSSSFYLVKVNLFDGSIMFGADRVSRFEKIEGGAYILSVTFPTELGGISSPTVQIYSNNNEQVWAGNGSDSMIFYAGQIENKTTPSSYIPTTDAPATRAPDIVSMPYENNVPRGDQPYTIIFKGIIDGYTSFNRLFGTESNGATERINTITDTGGKLYHANGGDINLAATVEKITFGKEFIYIVTSDGVNYTSYLGGVLQSSTAVISPATELPSEMRVLQGDNTTNNSNGKCSLFKTLPYAITADEVKLIS